MIRNVFDMLPLWAVFFANLTAISASLGAGMYLARRRPPAPADEFPVNAVVAATLALLGFLLAFTFGQASSRFDTRRDLVVQDAGAISTAYMRADMLSEPARSSIRSLLREYVDLRTKPAAYWGKNDALGEFTRIQYKMWEYLKNLPEDEKSRPLTALAVTSINDLIDSHAQRVAVAFNNRIPNVVWSTLYFVMVITMIVVGYHFGRHGRRNMVVIFGLAIVFSTVMLMIIGIDRAFEGLLQAQQGPMLDLQKELREHTP